MESVFFRIFPKNDKTYSGGYLRKILPDYILKSSLRISLASLRTSSNKLESFEYVIAISKTMTDPLTHPLTGPTGQGTV